MAAIVVPMSGLLGPSCSGLIVEERSRAFDQRSCSGGVLGFMKKERPAAALERIRAAGPSSSAALGVISCSSSGFSRRATVVAVSAIKQKQRSPIVDFDLDDNDENDDDGHNDEATEFADMEEWMRSKPAGFGLKEYDTSLEDRLLTDIETEKVAHSAVAKKKKARKPVKTTEKQGAPPQGVEVCVRNLPRKRNVDRDLRAAFRSARGLLHIRPIVDGNQKTREPMCKGLAFLTFASDNEAKVFIRRYNCEEVKFGKMEKKVICELAASNSPFKKQVFQEEGTDSPRLQIRDTTPISLSPPAYPSSHVAVDLVDTRDFSAPKSNLSDTLSSSHSDDLEEKGEAIESLDVSEDELLELEQKIWAELEDEDDFELDRELEGDDNEDVKGEKVRGPDAHKDETQNREENIEALEKRLLARASSASEKDPKISTAKRASNIEALEKRLLARASEKDPKISTAKRASGSKKPPSKVKSLFEGPSRPKLGGASRLKKKERELYTGVLSKYSPSATEAALSTT